MGQITSISAAKLIDLLRQASQQGDLRVVVLNSTRLGLGANPYQPQAVIDLLSENIEPFSAVAVPSPAPREPSPLNGGFRRTRSTGMYELNLRGRPTQYGSLKGLLAGALKEIETSSPGTLAKLANHKARTKRIVARDPKDLFDQIELAEKYAEPLIDGWFYGTNNSAEETKTWLRRACEYASLQWGKDLRINL